MHQPDEDELDDSIPLDGGPRYPGPGFRLGEYTLRDTLGHGSMATVYLAEDATGHEVAIKVFQEGPGVSPTMLVRFRREAEATKKLRRHLNVMKVYATGQQGPYHYIVMEVIRNNRTLEDMAAGKPDVTEVVQLAIKIAGALHYAHTRAIVHRDVKPANIMIDEFGEPRLSDFGVAELVDQPGVTMSGALTGTPLYMSPEQARADRVGPASDIYSLGVVLFEALTGELPYTTQHTAPVRSVLEAVRSELPRRPRSLRKDISRPLEAVILKAIEKDPGKRYKDAEEFAQDLESALSGRRVSARLFSFGTHFLALARQYDQFFAAALVMLTMGLGIGFFLYNKLVQERYDNLLKEVQFRNFTTRFSDSRSLDDLPAVSPGPRYDLREAQRAMSAGNLIAAREGFMKIVENCRSTGDMRSLALAQFELARCETLEGNLKTSDALYCAVIKNPDAPLSVVENAQLECLELTILRNDRRGAVDLLNVRSLPESGPLRDSIRCLAREYDPEKLEAGADAAPARLRNDVLMAAAMRYRADGNKDAYAAALRRCIDASTPASEWPGPLARSLRKQQVD